MSRLWGETLAGNPTGQSDKGYQAAMGQATRWLVQTGIISTLVFFALFIVSWAQWREYRDENRRLRTVADKYQVTSVMLNELYPELAVTVGAYEKLAETIGADSTLAVFHKRLEQVRNEEKESKQREFGIRKRLKKLWE